MSKVKVYKLNVMVLDWEGMSEEEMIYEVERSKYLHINKHITIEQFNEWWKENV